MKTSVYLILAFFLCLPVIARSQQVENKLASDRQYHDQIAQNQAFTNNDDRGMPVNRGGGGASEADYLPETGMYLEPGWMPGYVVLKDESILEGIMLRYDIYNQQFQFVRNGDTLAFANPHELASIQIGDHRFIYSGYQIKEASGVGYFEVLSGGDCQLLVRRKVAYHLSPGAKPRLDEDLYVRECEYYVMKGDSPAKPVRACRKSVLCAFSDKQDQIRAFIEDNELKMKTCDELKQVVAFYNSLP